MSVPPEYLAEYQMLQQRIGSHPRSIAVFDLVHLPQSDSFGICVGVTSDFYGGWDCLVLPLGEKIHVDMEGDAELFPASTIVKLEVPLESTAK